MKPRSFFFLILVAAEKSKKSIFTVVCVFYFADKKLNKNTLRANFTVQVE